MMTMTTMMMKSTMMMMMIMTRTKDLQMYRPLPLLPELVNYNVFNRNYIFFPKAKAKEVSMY